MLGHSEILKYFEELIEKNALSHGYIFFGAPRAGKRLAAVMIANYLETGKFEEPKILNDALLVEPDSEGTLGIDKARAIKNFLYQTPNTSPYRTVIIDNGESLTTEAQNALLKITEEPSLRALIFVIIDDPERLWPTLRSRLQKIYFPPVGKNEIKNWLVGDFKCEAQKAEKIAESSRGIPGLAYAILTDVEFQELRKTAEQFLKLPPYERRDFIKNLVDDEDFDLDKFLEALLVSLLPVKPEKAKLFHRILKLRSEINYYNLNPRLQLTALGALI